MFTINQNLIDDFADKINEKEKKSNKVTSLSSSSTDTQYPSAKIVYDSLNNLHTSNIKIAGEPLTNIWTGATIPSQAQLNTFINNHIGEIDARLQKEEIVYGSIYKTDSSRVYISGTYNKVCDSVGSQHPFLNEMILFKLPNDLNSSSTKSIKIKVIYYTTSYASSQNFFELPATYNNVAIKENTFASNTIILLKLNSRNNGFDIVGVFSPNSTGSYTDLTDKPTIPSKTSDLTNDSGFLTSHQSLSGYLQTSDVKDNLTSTDTNKPLSANQGKELKALIDNKEDNIYRIVGTEVSSPASGYARLHCGTFPFDSANEKLIVYVVPDISTLSESSTALIYGSYPSGRTTSTNIRKSNNEDLTIGEIRTGDELLLMVNGGIWRLIGNSSISNKEDKSNKISDMYQYNDAINEYPNVGAVQDYVSSELDGLQLGDLAFLDDIPDNITTENIDGYVGAVALSNDYDDLDNKPTIPTGTSDLINNSGFLTHQDITGKEDSSNKVSSWSSTTTDTHYPSEKLVKDSLDGKADGTHTHGNLSNDGKVSTTSNDIFEYFVGIGKSTNSLYKSQYLRADKIKDINAHSNIGSSANATQDTINTAIDSALDAKYSKNNIVTISSTNTVDLNNYTTSDFYIFAPINMLQYVSNAPNDLDDSVFYLLVEKRDVNYVKQTLTSKMGITWIRTKISNTGWNNWREQQSGGNINSGVNLLGQWSSYSNCSTTPVRTYSLYHSEPIDQIINSGVSDTTKYTDFLWTIRPTDFSYNDVFTLSFYAKGTNAKNFKTYFYGGSGYIGVKRISSNSTVSNSIGISSSFGDGATEFTLGSDWQKYYVTYKLNSSGTASVDKKIAIRIYGGTDFYLNSPKLERGYNATDYTPSNNARNINYNIDFNDYKSEGHYWIWNSEQTSNTNAPDTQGGLLIVYNIPNGCIQLLYQYWSPEAKIYYRIYHSTAGWRSWQKLTSEWKIFADSGNTKDLDDYIYHGFYYNNANTDCAYISNLPESGKAFFLLVEDWGSSNYTKQTITHYGTNNTYTRIRNSGTWSNWEKLAKGGDFEYVVGTHGTTATSTWTGTCSKLREIKDGTIIYYYLTSAAVSGTNVTLNLTLPSGTTTGAKNVYFKGTTRLTTQYPINSIVALVYTTKRDSGCWYVASANDNNSYNAQEYGGVQVIYGEAVTNTTLCGAKATDKKYYKLASELVLDTSYPIIYTNTTPSANANSNNLYNKRYDAVITNTKSISLTTGKPVYIEGSSYDKGLFTVSSNVITQTLTSGNYYWLIGHAYDATHFRMGMYETIYYYNGTNLEKVSDKTSVVDIIYPVGSIYMSVNSVSPSILFGGTWEQIEDTFLLASGQNYTAGSTGGSATVTLTANQSGLKAHGHGMAHTHSHSHGFGDGYVVPKHKDNWGYTNSIKIGTGGSGSAYYYPRSSTNGSGITDTSTTASNAQASSKSTTDDNTASNASEAHENMPPYLTVYMWKRTA